MSQNPMVSTTQDKKHRGYRMILSILLGLLTAYFCLYLADGMFGVQGLKITEYLGESAWFTPIYNKSVDRENQFGAVIFFVFAVGLPLLFSRWISWRDTLVNYWCYPIYWLVVDDIVESHPGHAFLSTGTEYYPKLIANVDLNFSPFVWTLLIYLIHSAVFMCFKNDWKQSEREKNT